MRLPKSSSIKVIDFGGTTIDSPQNTCVVSTRHYRAPEVILGKQSLLLFAIVLLLHYCYLTCDFLRLPQGLAGATHVIFGVWGAS